MIFRHITIGSMMRSNALFGGLLKPVPNEAFSAWLNRGLRSYNPAPFRRAVGCLEHWGNTDPDEPIGVAVLEELAPALGLSDEFLRRLFPLPGDWLKAPPAKRVQFCERCLLDDFRSGLRPTLRVTWFYWWLSVCPVHGCLLHASESTSAAKALFSFIQFYSSLNILTESDIRPSNRRVNIRMTTFEKLGLMAWYFQYWYLSCVKLETVSIGNVKLTAKIAQIELIMTDILAIIGKKRSYPFDQRSYIAQLLNIKSWCSLHSNLPPDAGCAPFLCLDIGEHDPQVRMAMFALLGLFLKLPQCARIWFLGRGEPSNPRIEQLWRSLLYEAVREPSYLAWFQQRSESWYAPLRTHFGYLLEG
ncbi:TniQ family protein [Pseudomonas viridiflava]|uniref:TniQ family protein n=1 Tax=Pseudomonas viridiflava TaxID=33069 RepID=UPI0013D077D6|nr:TniQ family protein [Pseudomonas viridiflava]